MKKTNPEFKVGLFVLLGLVVLGGLVLKTGDFYLKPGYTIHILFDYISGMDRGAPVRLAGVAVGEIKEVHVVRDIQGRTEVDLSVWIDGSAIIEEDAEIRISTLGLLGEKYIEILPGKSQTMMKNGTVVRGRAPIVMERITESGTNLLEKVETTVDSLNDILADPKFRGDTKETFANSQQVTKNLIQASADLKEAAASAKIVMGRLERGEGAVGRLLKDDTIAQDLGAFVKDIKKHPWKLFKRS
jgi:phospholipid/cholesterol/gamma-HCH transport system substrate-binding protein